MSYKKVLIPPDEEEIFEGWTWGEHRAIEKSLYQLEMDSDTLAAARQRLDDKLLSAGVDPNAPRDKSHFICEYCKRDEWLVHAEDCPDYDPADRTAREAAAYQYMDEGFHDLHTTSVPVNDADAVDYFRIVAIWFPSDPPKYLLRKEFGADTFHMIPWQYVDGEVKEIVPLHSDAYGIGPAGVPKI
jgi:hypothetical protein